MNTEEKITRERKLAKDALKKLGYRMSNWGWVKPDRVVFARNEGYIKGKSDDLGFTYKGLKHGAYAIMDYIGGGRDSV